MNYGKKKAAKRQKKITSKSTMQGKRIVVRLFKALLICIILAAVVGVAGGGLFIKKIIDDTPHVSASDVKPKGFTTFVYADDGSTEIERFVSSGSNRVYKSIDEIPKDLQHAFVAIEDERFYKHNGIDLQGIARAAVVGIARGGNFTEGASTLTQQLIKNNVFPNFTKEKTFYDKFQRKIQEQYLALQIEKKMDKSEIIESYLNTINLGQNCLGVQAASQRYFGKDVSDLTLSECAVIAGITQSPSTYDPITHPDNNKVRRNKVLKNMLEQGYISQKQYDEALADDVYARIQTTNTASQADNTYSYFVDALAQQVIQDLKDQLGYTDTQAYNAVYSGGLSIYSTQNQTMQQICDEEANDDSNYPGLKEYGLDYALTVTRADGSTENYGSNNIKNYVKETYGKDQGLLYSSEDAARAMVEEWKATIAREGDTYDERITITPQPQSSITIMDQKTGQIKAMVGGRGEKASSLGLNRAYQGSKRQPGSTFKILAAYAPALDSCDKTLATTIDDEPYTLKNGQVLRNANKQYGGTTTLREGIKRSINVVAVKLSDEITQELGYEYCQKFGISTLVKNKTINGKVFDDSTSQTLALGGITEGVYNYEMCAAYATIANGGEYNKPTLYSKVVDHDGNVLLDGTGESHTVIKDSTAYLLTNAMEDVVNSGTGTACQLPNMPVAGKTGTTTSNKDLWFCGFTPYYTCAVWGGYDDNKECDYDTSFRFRLWKGIMSRIHENLEEKDFKVPSSVERKSICTITGKLAGSGCPSITEYFAKDTLPAETCSGHGYSYGSKSNSSTEDDSSSNANTSGSSTREDGSNSATGNTTGNTTAGSDTTGGTTTGGSTGGTTGGSTGGSTGGTTGGSTGGTTGGSTGGSTGGTTGGSTESTTPQ
ncbi:PBP1A family penicillin-binding protein [Dorea longicatena]|uniref:transglycosylase domain-containing protein n=1 Tax=Dorea longicatena TaxID=88431 RepID=UPI000E4C339A|nr:PBP1A family penicillin-binding protein [Dorea longicatena]RGU07167.1 PBP1A family penicillin-binding protein [Dorea longicatena]